MTKKILALFALTACLGMVGCTNTVEGAGEDISKAGNAISNSVK
ncbi:entericidin A/B family lipoprotein [Pollutimonas harenae]|uniref:Entericidin A/B family lipoprotein n=1 Tax=Pollutimonas harenae TaxID=657015 RepID=A0A853H6V7_9BURK|nr:entericidin A/B family lipoprotein [Pollutimonas harenae]NYT85834.1 entericidin A/B family lipoprotein [Pollutimonas harenae]TEA70892.1 entericidin A/B family lipoprotein [Pollutimonas harenae]